MPVSDEAVQALQRSVDASRGQPDEEPMVFSAIVHASRGESDRIDPQFFRYQPEDILDGDLAEWIGAAYASLNEKQHALAFLRQAVQRGNHNYSWFQRDKSWDKLRGDPEYQRIMAEVEDHWKHYVELFGKAPS